VRGRWRSGDVAVVATRTDAAPVQCRQESPVPPSAEAGEKLPICRRRPGGAARGTGARYPGEIRRSAAGARGRFVENRRMYTISTDRTRFDIAAIHAFLSRSYWSPGIPLATVERAIAHSLAFGVFDGVEQVGFARVVTDRATFAYLADVYILEGHRGQGLARKLVETILAHEDLQGLRRFLLATRDAHPLYAAFGFKPLAAPDRMMEIHDPHAYEKRPRA
jgi:GNAT superfamily N-acetyltransferase